jgi:CMP-N,N'-diacetyllegionaminic acid synthase
MIKSQSVLAIILARGGSKGFPGKNIAPLGDKPLIAWSVEAARHAKYTDRVVLSSDNQAIIDAARRFHCEVPFVRPAELARDDTPAVDVVLHALEQLPSYDILVLLQPTSPFRDHNDIDRAIDTMVHAQAKSCVSVCEVDKSPYWMYTTDACGRLQPLLDLKETQQQLYRQQRQQLPRTYALNGAIYVIYTDWFHETHKFVNEETVPYIMPKERSVDIDDPLDLKWAEFLLQQWESQQHHDAP